MRLGERVRALCAATACALRTLVCTALATRRHSTTLGSRGSRTNCSAHSRTTVNSAVGSTAARCDGSAAPPEPTCSSAATAQVVYFSTLTTVHSTYRSVLCKCTTVQYTVLKRPVVVAAAAPRSTSCSSRCCGVRVLATRPHASRPAGHQERSRMQLQPRTALPATGEASASPRLTLERVGQRLLRPGRWLASAAFRRVQPRTPNPNARLGWAAAVCLSVVKRLPSAALPCIPIQDCCTRTVARTRRQSQLSVASRLSALRLKQCSYRLTSSISCNSEALAKPAGCERCSSAQRRRMGRVGGRRGTFDCLSDESGVCAPLLAHVARCAAAAAAALQLHSDFGGTELSSYTQYSPREHKAST